MKSSKVNFFEYNLLSKFINILPFWRKLKISQRIFTGFLVGMLSFLFLFIFNTIIIYGLSNITKQVSVAKDEYQIVQQFKYTMESAKVHTAYVKRFIDTGNVLQPTEENQIAMIQPSIEANIDKITSVIRKHNPAKLEDFKTTVNRVFEASETWLNDKTGPKLISLNGIIQMAIYDCTSLLQDLTTKIDLKIKSIETIKTIAMISSISINFLFLLVLIIFIFPLLSELKHAFHPLHDASQTALHGAQESLSYASDITNAISQLQDVLKEMGAGITEVTNNAMESSAQSSNIINSVKIATDFVGDLAQKASNTLLSLNSYQKNLQVKVEQVNNLTINVNNALQVVKNNTDVAEKLAQQLALLDSKVQEITKILVSVSDINEQTNLLSLNASIEAARAGEYGAGFDIVAQRIRHLSDQTKRLTLEINKTVKGIQGVSIEVTSSLTNVISSVRNSTQEVSLVTHEFSEISNVLQSLYQSNNQIISAANIQLDSTHQIHNQTAEILQAVKMISSQTDSVSASMEELAASSEEINAQTHMINELVMDTQQVIEKQVGLAALAKKTAEQI